MRALAAMVLAAALAGCLGGPDAPPGPTGSDDVLAPLPTALYLNGAGALTPAIPVGEAPERYDVGSFYSAWTVGEEQPTWTMPNPFAGAIASRVVLTFYYTADPATPTTGPQDQGFPEFVVYAGVTGAPMAWASVTGPDLVRTGEVVEVVAELALPMGGLVVPAEASPVVKVAPVQGQTDQNPIVLLLNSTKTPSRLEWDLEPFDAPAVVESVLLDTLGTAVGSAYAAGAVEGVTSASFPIDVPSDAVGLRVRMERTGGAGIADVDLAVLGPGGDVAAQSVTPEPREGVDLWLPNLEAAGGAGTWVVQVTNYGNVQVEFHVDAAALLVAPGA